MSRDEQTAATETRDDENGPYRYTGILLVTAGRLWQELAADPGTEGLLRHASGIVLAPDRRVGASTVAAEQLPYHQRLT